MDQQHKKDPTANTLGVERIEQTATPHRGQQALSMEEILPPHDFGAWPEGFTANREQIYGEDGR